MLCLRHNPDHDLYFVISPEALMYNLACTDFKFMCHLHNNLFQLANVTKPKHTESTYAIAILFSLGNTHVLKCRRSLLSRHLAWSWRSRRCARCRTAKVWSRWSSWCGRRRADSGRALRGRRPGTRAASWSSTWSAWSAWSHS